MKNALLVLLCLLFSVSFAQDPILRQPYSNPLWMNPASTGGGEGKSINASYRSQWGFLGSSLRTLFVAAEIPVDQLNSGFGILFLDDRSPDNILMKNQYMVSYAYSLKLGEKLALRAGLKGGIIHSRMDISKLRFAVPIDPAELGYKPAVFPTFGTGFLLSGRRFDFGVSADHLNQPHDGLTAGSNSKLHMHFQCYGSYSFGSEKLSFSPYLHGNFQAGYQIAKAGAYLNFAPFFYGIAVLNTKTILFTAGLDLNHLRFSYGYDISHFGNTYHGAHEVMLSLVLPDKTERKKMKVMHHPIFNPIVN